MLASFLVGDVWAKLHVGDPGVAGTANPAINTQRQKPTWTTPALGATNNSVAITWASVPASETYTHLSLWTSASGGTLRGTDQLAAPAPITAGNPFVVAIGDLLLQVT